MNKLINILLLLFFSISANCKEVNLYQVFLKIRDEAIVLSKTMNSSSANVTDKLSNFSNNFYNSKNILSGFSTGALDIGDCEILDLKPNCLSYVYSNKQIINKNIGCLKIYAKPKFKYSPEEYIVEETIIFKKVKKNWLIQGNKYSIIKLTDFAYAYFKRNDVSHMFLNVCNKRQMEEYNQQ